MNTQLALGLGFLAAFACLECCELKMPKPQISPRPSIRKYIPKDDELQFGYYLTYCDQFERENNKTILEERLRDCPTPDLGNPPTASLRD